MDVTLKSISKSNEELLKDNVAKGKLPSIFLPTFGIEMELLLKDDDYSYKRQLIIYEGINPVGYCQYYPLKDDKETWYGNIEKEGTYAFVYFLFDNVLPDVYLDMDIISQIEKKIKFLSSAKLIITKIDKDEKNKRTALINSSYFLDDRLHLYFKQL